MISLTPKGLSSIDDPRLHRLRESLIDREIVGVTYAVPAGTRWPNGHRNDRQVDEVEMGVELRISSDTTVRLSWATPGSDEGLNIDFYECKPPPAGWIVDKLEVSDRTGWLPRIGRPIAEIALAFYSYDGAAEDRPWSFSLRFSDRSVVAVALGEAHDAELSYMPDSLVVIFDEVVARAYKVADSRSSALGETVPYGIA